MSVMLAVGKIRSEEVLYTTDNILRKVILYSGLMDAKIVIDVDEKSWHFSDETYNVFELQFEDSVGRKDTKSAQICAEKVLRVDEGHILSSGEKDALNKLLKKYEDVFGPFPEHKIDTGDHTPVYSSSYPIPNHKKEVLREEIDEMLSDELIEPYELPWASSL
ncbi:hypothetical protein ILUMI_12022, partial [Ignelater luminosus]